MKYKLSCIATRPIRALVLNLDQLGTEHIQNVDSSMGFRHFKPFAFSVYTEIFLILSVPHSHSFWLAK